MMFKIEFLLSFMFGLFELASSLPRTRLELAESNSIDPLYAENSFNRRVNILKRKLGFFALLG